MKYLILLCVCLSNTVFSQNNKKFFTDKNNDFTVLVPENTKIEQDTALMGIEFTKLIFFNNDNSFKYVLTINEIPYANITDTTSNINSFSSECKCKLDSTRWTKYNNFSSHELLYSRNDFIGIYNFIYLKNKTFVINFLTNKNSLSLYKKNYEDVLNNFIFNQ